MRRSALFLLLLLLAPALHAQGAEALLDRILSPKSSPTERSAFLDQILKDDAGAEALSKRGLDPALEPEILHAVVDKLFTTGRYAPRLGRIVFLLVQGSPEVQRNVRTRIQRVAEQPDQGPALRQRLREVAEGKSADASGNGRVRLGAVRALSCVPHRDALEAIVAVGRADADRDVQAACRAAIGDVFPTDDLERAEFLLRAGERITWSYADFLLDRARTLRREYDAVSREYRESLRQVLRSRGALFAFETLEKGNAYAREVAAERLARIALDGDFKEVPQDKFAEGILRAFRAAVQASRRDGGDPSLAHLLDTMALLGAGAADAAPLWKAVPAPRLLEEMQTLTDTLAEDPEAGLAAVRLISVFGDPGIGLLRSFGEGARVAQVRERAGRALADRARDNPGIKEVVGRHLVDLLLRERDGGVRNALLQALREAPVEQAIDPVQQILFPDPADPRSLPLGAGLAARAPDYCMAILKQLPSARAFDLLVRGANEHARAEVRRAAMEALLQRGAALGDETAAREGIEAVTGIALNPNLPIQGRADAVAVLADLGTRDASAAIEAIRAAEALPPELASAVRGAMYRLAEKLCDSKAVGAEGRADFDEAKKLLRLVAESESPERLVALARRIAEGADARSLPAGSARAILARAFRGLPDADAAEVRRLHGAAADRAASDGLTPAQEIELLREYRALIPQESAEEADSLALLRCAERLGELSSEDAAAASGYYLDAAETAVRRLRDREAAERNLESAERSGAATGASAERLRALRAAAEALPRRPEPTPPE